MDSRCDDYRRLLLDVLCLSRYRDGPYGEAANRSGELLTTVVDEPISVLKGTVLTAPHIEVSLCFLISVLNGVLLAHWSIQLLLKLRLLFLERCFWRLEFVLNFENV